ncbi:hypothetical protein Glove_299g41 [Diversispora epigaea]|uniref:Uncharacterized protein n=1 Tax=Diversispora epigaea TaxID=1348612 RepID=A0A397I200_9GLOM|nr:hypothetical protein Glove_299g41 [Diversispora epigaea]
MFKKCLINVLFEVGNQKVVCHLDPGFLGPSMCADKFSRRSKGKAIVIPVYKFNNNLIHPILTNVLEQRTIRVGGINNYIGKNAYLAKDIARLRLSVKPALKKEKANGIVQCPVSGLAYLIFFGDIFNGCMGNDNTPSSRS